MPPQGPGGFYPYWSQVQRDGSCALEFGNVSRGLGLTTFGKDAQYGTNQFNTLGYPEFIGPSHNNPCLSIRLAHGLLRERALSRSAEGPFAVRLRRPGGN